MREPLAVCVAVATCDRPDTLDLLLKSLSVLHRPPDCRFRFVVVDNGQGAAAIVEANRRAFGADSLDLVIEPRPGIPFSRNRALDHALGADADLLLFLDDDEEADPFWLSALVGKYREGNADLIGGPVFARSPAVRLTGWQAYLMKGIERWYRVRQSRNERRARQGRESRIVLVTNNWLLDMGFLRRTGLRFDEGLSMAGGSDVRFFHDAVRSGGRTSWCLDAIAFERIPPERLSARYIAFRARQQAISHFQRRRGGRPGALRSAMQVAAAVPLVPLGIARILLAPILGPYSLVDGCRLCGRAAGKVLSAFGASSRLYRFRPAADRSQGAPPGLLARREGVGDMEGL